MTHKRKLRGIAILITLAFLLSLLPAGMAGAASTYTPSHVASLEAGKTYTTGLPTITIDLKALTTTGYVYLSLPSTPTGWGMEATVTVPSTVGSVPNALGSGNVSVYPASGTTDEICLNITGTLANPGNDGRILLSLTKLVVPSGFSGDIALTAEAPDASPFTSGKVVIGRVGAGDVSLSVDEVRTISSGGGTVYIKIKENGPGALKGLKLTLPPGFSWSSVATEQTYWGNITLGAYEYGSSLNDGRDLKVNVTTASTSESYFKVRATINVDETVAKYGDVEVSVSGENGTSVATSSLVVAKYGDYGAKIYSENTGTIYAGKAEERLDARLVIEEYAPGSLVDGRTVTLTLPENVRWAKATPVLDNNLTKNKGTLNITWQWIGSDGRTLKGTISGSSAGQTEGAKLVYKDFYVTAAPDFTGDLNVDVAGSAGLSGSVTLAKVEAPVQASVEGQLPEVKIGLPGQTVADFTIVEAKKEAVVANVVYSKELSNGALTSTTLSSRARLTVKAPAGVTFTGVPKVEVIEGDLVVDAAGVATDTTSNNEGLLYIPIKSSSTKPSKIKVSGVKLTLDRTVPEGDLKLKIRDTAVNQTLNSAGTDQFFPGHKDVASVTVAKVVTPAPTEVKTTAVLQIGSTTMKVNGVDVSMDVAPYLKNSRTYVPVRFCAKALGIDESNIIWDGATQTATIVAGAKVIQMKVGSKAMIINGASVNMDTAPELVPPGRVCLPIGWLAWALGAKTSWDNATQTATLEL